MKQPTISEMSHLILGWYLKDDMICADLTAGNGNDTLFLANHCKKVYSFDIQAKAISRTKELTKQKTNIEYINDNHINIDKYLKEDLDAAIFNFGYLPNANHELTTKAATSLDAVKKVMYSLKEGGMLLLAFYPHEEGIKERIVISSWLRKNRYLISVYQTERSNSPCLYIVSK